LVARARISSVVPPLLGALLAALPARAEDEPPALPTVDAALELAAPEGCGSEAELATSITRRSDRIRIDPTSTRRLHIQIRAEGKLTRVDLELAQPSGRKASRTLRASSCSEALEAAALVAAVSLDPTASALLEPPPPEPPPPEPPKSPPPPPPKKKPPPPPPPEPSERLVVSVGLLGEAVFGPAPTAMLGVAGLVMLGWERDSILSPAVRLRGGADWASQQVSADNPGIVKFRLTYAAADLCPIRIGIPVIAFLPCAHGAAGVLWAAGRQFPRDGFASDPWYSIGGSVIGLLRPSGPLELQASMAVAYVPRRESFELTGPLQEIHTVRPIVWSPALSLGVVFQ